MPRESPTAEVYALLIPLQQGSLIVPRTCVAEVAGGSGRRTARPDIAGLAGTVEWRGWRLPLVAFEAAAGLPPASAADRGSWIVVMRAITPLEPPFYGVLACGLPRLVRVTPDMLRLDDPSAASEGSAICRLRVRDQRPWVPDLEELERRIGGSPPR